jgi:hypothetical protein
MSGGFIGGFMLKSENDVLDMGTYNTWGQIVMKKICMLKE